MRQERLRASSAIRNVRHHVKIPCRIAAVMTVTAFIQGCSSTSERMPGVGLTSGPRIAHHRPAPSGLAPPQRARPHFKIGKPYYLRGVRYVPRHDPHYDRTGIASWYGGKFHGRLTANGEIYNMNAITAAHPTLPLPSMVRVTNLRNGRQLDVRVNDRGPYAHNRIIDLSRRSAQILGLEQAGTGPVRVQYLGPARLGGKAAPRSTMKWLRTRVASLGRYVPNLRARGSVTGGASRKITWAAPANCLAPKLRRVIANIAANYGRVRVNSTCRSRSHNRRVGGARNSYHLSGDAADIRVYGNWPGAHRYLYRVVGGLKHYGGGLFHIDMGPRRRF